MDSFELNKIMGAVLGTLLFVMGVGFLAEAIYHPVVGQGPGYPLPEPEVTEGGGGEEVVAVSIATLLASADPVAGADQANKCQACHDFSEANTNKTGPGLYDTVERLIASHEGFAYSPILQEYGAAGETWTYENLNEFLLSPKGFAPGTKMTFAGVKNDQERANIIAYMSTLSPSPKPFPAPDAGDEGVAPGDDEVTDAVSSVEPTEAVDALEGTETGGPDAPATGATTDTPPGERETGEPEPADLTPPSAEPSEEPPPSNLSEAATEASSAAQ